MSSMVLPVYLFIATLILVGVGVAYFLSRKKKTQEITKSLNIVLYEVTLPHEKPSQEEDRVKELSAIMEQFYDGLSNIDSYFALEIGLPAKGKELVFYVAIDKQYAQLLEKQVQGLFPQASLHIKQSDYNVFKPEGFSAGAIAALKNNPLFPIKTYDKFEMDPLQVIINVFSKLQEEGEGAALQILAWPSKEDISTRAKNAAFEVRKGKTFSEATENYKSLGKGVMAEVGKFATGSTIPAKDPLKKAEEERQKTVDEELAKLLEDKASRRTVSSNIRLVASSTSREKANSILLELESAFSQFSQMHGNSLDFVRLSGAKLKDFFYKFSFRIPDKKKFIWLNTMELATIFHFPRGIASTIAPQLKYANVKEVPPPLNLPESGVLLGKNLYRGELSDVYMKQVDRRRHFYVIGQTGTGKSVLLKNMIAQDIENGKGICFIDPHGSDLQDILARIPQSRMDDVVYFNPADVANPMGLNMLEYDERFPEQKSFIVDELLGIFNKLFDMKTAGGPMFEQYFRNSALLVMDSPKLGNTLLELERVLSDTNFRQQKLMACTSPTVKAFWRDVAEKAGGEASLSNMVPYITSKFDTFLSNEIMRPIISQEKSSFNFRDIMDNEKILLVNLAKGRLGDINSNLIGLIIVGKLLMASLSRVDISEEQRKDFYLYIDEFQNVTTDSISTILSEARKYKLNLTIAHQFIAQLEDKIKEAVFGNVGSIASFRVGVEDGEFLAKQFEPVFTSNDLVNINNYNSCVKLLIDGQVSRPFTIQTIPFEKGDPTIAGEVARLSSVEYGRPREELEKEISRKYGV